MKLTQTLGVATWAWRGALALVFRPVIWVPLLVIAVVQFAVLLLLLSFHRNLILPLGFPLVRLLGGEMATHYPVFFFLLPDMFAKANLVVGAIVTAIAGGAATLLFARAYGLKEGDRPWTRSFRRAATLIPLSVLVLGLLYALGHLTRLIPTDLMLTNGKVRWGTRAAMLLLFVLVQGFFVYTTAWVVVMGHKFWPAVRDSVRVTLRTFLPTMMVVALPAVILFPFSYTASRMDLVARKFRPELIVGLLSARIVVEFLIMFLLIGAITRMFLWRLEEAR